MCALLATPVAQAQDAPPEAAAGATPLVLEVFDVRDLLAETTNFPAPRLGLTPTPAAPPETTIARPGRTEEQLARSVREIASVAWPEGTSIQLLRGTLVVRQSEPALTAIRTWLEALRAAEHRLIAVEARVLAVPAATVDHLSDGLHIIRPERAQAILALTKAAGGGRVVSAPRVTAFDGQRANVCVANQVSYVSGVGVTATRGAIVGHPIVSTLTEGLTLEIRAHTRHDGWIDVEVAVQAAHLLRPMPQVATRFGIVQVPELVAQSVRVRGSLPKDSWAMLVGLTEVRADGRAGDPVVVLVRFQPIAWR